MGVFEQQKAIVRRYRQALPVEMIGTTVTIPIDAALINEILHVVDEQIGRPIQTAGVFAQRQVERVGGFLTQSGVTALEALGRVVWTIVVELFKAWRTLAACD